MISFILLTAVAGLHLWILKSDPLLVFMFAIEQEVFIVAFAICLGHLHECATASVASIPTVLMIRAMFIHFLIRKVCKQWCFESLFMKLGHRRTGHMWP